MNKTYLAIAGYANISSYLTTFKVYQKGSDNRTVELEMSTECSTPDAEFCFKNSDINRKATIYGDYFADDNDKVDTKYLTFEAVWCDTSLATCPP